MRAIETVYVAPSEPFSLRMELKAEVPDEGYIEDDEDGIDYSFFGNSRWVFWERKEWSDLVHSFTTANEKSGEPRIISQIRRMVDLSEGENTLVCLLVEGLMRCTRDGYCAVGKKRTGVPYTSIDGFLGLIQSWGVRVYHSASTHHSAGRLLAVSQSWLDTREKGPIIMLPRAPSPQIRSLMTWPRVGVKNAKALLKQHKDLRMCYQVAVEGKPLGLGTGVDKAVQQHLGRQ